MPTNSTRTNCHYFFSDTRRCGSPALRGEGYCYYHHPVRKPVANPRARAALRGFELPIPYSRETLHQAVSEVMLRLAANKLDVHRASLILYSLQIASRNLSPDE